MASLRLLVFLPQRGFDNSGKQAAQCRNVRVNRAQFAWLAASGTADTGAMFPATKSENMRT